MIAILYIAILQKKITSWLVRQDNLLKYIPPPTESVEAERAPRQRTLCILCGGLEWRLLGKYISIFLMLLTDKWPPACLRPATSDIFCVHVDEDISWTQQGRYMAKLEFSIFSF